MGESHARHADFDESVAAARPGVTAAGPRTSSAAARASSSGSDTGGGSAAGSPGGDEPDPDGTGTPGAEQAPLVVVADAAGRLRLRAPWVVGSTARAVAVEQAVAVLSGVRGVHCYPRTGSVVIWYRHDRADRDQLLSATSSAIAVAWDAAAPRAPLSAEVSNADLARMVVGGAALVLLGVRRYGLRRPALLGPASRVAATGVTIFTGYPFLRGALRSLTGGRGPGTDALVSAATVASLILRENVVALTVLWLLNIGEYLQDLTLRRTRRAITDLLSGAVDTVWVRVRTTDGWIEQQWDVSELQVGDEVVVYDHTAIPVDGEIVEGSGVLDQSAITGESRPSPGRVCR